jgi:hypothetical protein
LCNSYFPPSINFTNTSGAINVGTDAVILKLALPPSAAANFEFQHGLEGFTVQVTSSDDDRTTLNGKIIITPLYPVERIIVDFVLTNDGVTYSA